MGFIKLKDIQKKFGFGENEVIALNKINLEVEKGELLAITGKSGCGKSTLLNILGGLCNPTSGEYLFNNDNISKYSQNKLAKFRNDNIGFVVQNFALINDMTVFDNVMLPLKYTYKRIPNKKEVVESLLVKLGIENKAKMMPSKLSGGQCQRVSIARALACNPEVLLADEPTGSLDEETGKNILNIFKELNKSGMTVIMVTHDLDIASLCSRKIEMKDGKII
ncbi:MAG: ABC transporter ATP-binding protein [Clostridia bacterium]|nr:ABC transporter ATP-binding protein [Clostridia bacterium]